MSSHVFAFTHIGRLPSANETVSANRTHRMAGAKQKSEEVSCNLQKYQQRKSYKMNETETEIKNKLDKLADFQAQRDAAMLEKQSLLDEIYTAEIKSRMAEIEAEFAGKTEGVTANIAALEAEIKQAVINHGASVKGSFFHAVFSKGRVSWDTKGLDGYATANPELLSFRKEGEPSVSIRVAK